MAYNIQIEYVRGSTNIFADLLSRLPRNEELRNMIEAREHKDCIVMRIEAAPGANLAPKFKNIVQLQSQDPVIGKLKEKAPRIGCHKNSIHAMKDDMLYKLDGRSQPVWKLYVPACLEEELILTYHQSLGHSGVTRVILAIQEHLYIKRLGNKARKIISRCTLCQKAKQMNIKYDVEPQAILRDKPRALIVVDSHGPLPMTQFGYKHIFILTDVFSKFTKIYPMKSINTKACLAKILQHYIPTYGDIESLLSDNATPFANARWRNALEEKGIKVYHSSAYHPASNPCERFVKDVSIYLRIFCHHNHKNCFKYCEIIESIMNRSPNPTTKFSPEYLFTGKEPPSLFHGIPPSLPVPTSEEVDKMKLAYERCKKRAEKRRECAKRSKHKWHPKIGDKVLVRQHKLSSKLKQRYHRMELVYAGPFVISKIFGTYHRQFLRPYKE